MTCSPRIAGSPPVLNGNTGSSKVSFFCMQSMFFVMPSIDNGGKNCGKLFWFIFEAFKLQKPLDQNFKIPCGVSSLLSQKNKCFQNEIDDLLGFSVSRQLLVQISIFFTSVINISFHGFSQRRLLGSAYTKEDYSVCQDASIHNRLYLRPEYKYLPLMEVVFCSKQFFKYCINKYI